MRTEELSFRSGHVWFGDASDKWKFIPTSFVDALVPADLSLFEPRQTSSLCIKLYLTGDPARFGILGCDFTPTRSEATEIRVGIFEREGESGIGLMKDCAEAVKDEVTRILNVRNTLGPGILHFNRGAYHLVDSGPSIFRLLTNMILFVLSSPQDLSESDLNEKLLELLRSRNR
jgi:hypothetical protein